MRPQPTVVAHPPRPRGRPKAEDIKALEARIILVALQTFVANGYGATSIAAIARAARVSKNTLYARFPSKAELFRAIIDETVATTDFATDQDGRAAEHSLEATLRAYAEHMLRASLAGDLLQVNRLIYSESGRFPELGEAASARMQIGVQQVAAHIREASLREGVACRDPDSAAEIFIMILRGWYGDVMLTNRDVSGPEIDAAVEKILRVFMAGRPDW